MFVMDSPFVLSRVYVRSCIAWSVGSVPRVRGCLYLTRTGVPIVRSYVYFRVCRARPVWPRWSNLSVVHTRLWRSGRAVRAIWCVPVYGVKQCTHFIQAVCCPFYVLSAIIWRLCGWQRLLRTVPVLFRTWCCGSQWVGVCSLRSAVHCVPISWVLLL